jgi:hypothetical protein
MTYIVKATVMDVATDTHTAGEVPVKTVTQEYHQGDEVDLAGMDQARVDELVAAGAIEDKNKVEEQKKEAEKAAEEAVKAQEHQTQAAEHQPEHRNRHT